jgi:hypothetical protein
MTKRLPFLLLIILLIPCWGIALKPGGDLGVYYQASVWLQKGWVTKLYSDNAEIGNFFYGPFGLALLKPLALLSFSGANLLWLGLQTLSYFGFWFFLFKIFPELLSPLKKGLFLLVWVVSIKPIHASFQSHNVQLIFAAILAASEWGSRSESAFQKWLSGIAVALVASIKIYPAFIALYYLLKRPKEVKMGLLLGGLISLLIPLEVFGFSTGLSLPKLFIDNLLHYHQVYDLAKDTVSLSLPSLLATYLPQSWIHRGAISLIVGLISLWFFTDTFLSRLRVLSNEERYHWAFLWSMMGLLNSTTRPDYFIYFVPAFTSLPLLIEKEKMTKVYYIGLTVSVLLIAFITEWVLGSRELTHHLESLRVPVLGVLLLCLMQFLALRNKLKI